MSRYFLITGTSLLSLFAASAASAADLPTRMYTKAPPLPPAISWTGAYFGGNVGGAWLQSDQTVDYPTIPASGAAGYRNSNVIGGLQLGYNWQVSPNWLWGLEGDVSFSRLENGGVTLNFGGTDHIDTNAKLTTQGAIRGRLGWTSNAWLVYATGGVAFGATETSVSVVRNGVGSETSTKKDTRVGWTVGGGVEYMFQPNWIAGVEYRYTDLGSTNVTDPAGAFPAAHGDAFGRADYKINDVRFRLSYKY